MNLKEVTDLPFNKAAHFQTLCACMQASIEHFQQDLLFDKALALLPGQEDLGSLHKSADQRHLLATIPQLQRFHP